MLASLLDPTSGVAIILQVLIILTCLIMGTRFGGMGLGLISGIGLMILVFLFGLAPGEPPVSVMLTIVAVIGCAATLQQGKGLDVMMQFAEKLLRKKPELVTILAPITTWSLTVLCGTGHVVYTMFPIIQDIALKKGHSSRTPDGRLFDCRPDGYHSLPGLRGHRVVGVHFGRKRRHHARFLLHPANLHALCRPRCPGYCSPRCGRCAGVKTWIRIQFFKRGCVTRSSLLG